MFLFWCVDDCVSLNGQRMASLIKVSGHILSVLCSRSVTSSANCSIRFFRASKCKFAKYTGNNSSIEKKRLVTVADSITHEQATWHHVTGLRHPFCLPYDCSPLWIQMLPKCILLYMRGFNVWYLRTWSDPAGGTTVLHPCPRISEQGEPRSQHLAVTHPSANRVQRCWTCSSKSSN